MIQQNEQSPTPAGDESRADYAAARTQVAMFDLPGRTHLELTGRDRVKFLHNFCTNDVRGLAPGQGCEAFITNVQGKVLAHVFVFAEPESLWIETVPGAVERLVAHLSKYQITEEVEFADRTAELQTLLLVGPLAAGTLNRIGLDPPGGHLSQSRPAANDDPQLVLRRNDFLRLPGYELVGPPASIASLRERLQSAGVRPGTPPALEALRIEAAFPEYGLDVTDGNLAQEVNRTAKAVSFTKGCYLGQEPIARIDALGHVNQQLRVVRLAAGTVPPPGSDVVTVEPEPRVIGRITTSAISFERDLPVALAYLRRGSDMPGLHLAVRVGIETIPAVVWWPEE